MGTAPSTTGTVSDRRPTCAGLRIAVRPAACASSAIKEVRDGSVLRARAGIADRKGCGPVMRLYCRSRSHVRGYLTLCAAFAAAGSHIETADMISGLETKDDAAYRAA